MQIPKDKILEMLQQQGKSDQVDQVDQAKQELPDQVDPEQRSDLLQKFGLNPQQLLSKLGGGIPGLQSISCACPQRSTIGELAVFDQPPRRSHGQRG